MNEKSCVNCYFAHANCEDKAFACEYEDHVCDEYMSITKIEHAVIDRVLEIIDEAAADYEAVPTEIDVGREKAVISFEKKDGMLAMASMIRVLVLGLRGEGQ